MKYTNSIGIALPRERVAQLLADPAHLPKWLRDLVLHEPLNGINGQLGTTARVVMRSGRRKIECTETITRRGRGGRFLMRRVDRRDCSFDLWLCGSRSGPAG